MYLSEIFQELVENRAGGHRSGHMALLQAHDVVQELQARKQLWVFTEHKKNHRHN